ncbi:MAG: hypothetical protein RLZZ226_2060 [Pseudomonadota bacterium]|jgi:hypothetical protein
MNAATTEPFEQDDYDSPWKEAIEHHFPEFMAFFFADEAASVQELDTWGDAVLSTTRLEDVFGPAHGEPVQPAKPRAPTRGTPYIGCISMNSHYVAVEIL